MVKVFYNFKFSIITDRIGTKCGKKNRFYFALRLTQNVENFSFCISVNMNAKCKKFYLFLFIINRNGPVYIGGNKKKKKK